MSAPIDVTIVRPKHSTSALVGNLIGGIVRDLVNALVLMLLARYLREQVSDAVPALGYIDCLVILWAANLFSLRANPAWWYTRAPGAPR